MKNVKVIIGEEQYEEFKDIKKVMDGIGKFFTDNNTVLYKEDHYKMGVVRINAKDIERLLNDYYGLYDISIGVD